MWGSFRLKTSSVTAIEPKHDIRYFAYARHALVEALRLSGCGSGDRVLVPEFICRDVLGSIHSLGAEPVFYEVTPTLAPRDLDQAQPAKAVLAVNYFGFPQDLEPFGLYSQRTGAVVIEDNAHGFLSKTEDGQLLGTRTDLGIVSIRKTFRLQNGAALYVNNAHYVALAQPQLPFTNSRQSLGLLLRNASTRIQRSTHLPVFSLLQFLIRLYRQARTGSKIPLSDPASEKTLPAPTAPHQSLQRLLSTLDPERESARRKDLYITVGKRLSNLPITHVFPTLPPAVVPYGYPIIAAEGSIELVRTSLRGLSVEVIHWPDLPGAIRVNDEHMYRNIWVVNFL